MISKNERLFAIKELISTMAVGSQDELKRLLKKRGFETTQATLSRDMKELGVVWVSGSDGGRYALQPSEELRVLRPSVSVQVSSIVANEYVIVVQTLPGCASIVAELIDLQRSPDIIGTIAGDNTVLVVPRSVRKTQDVLEFLKNTLIKGID